MNDATYGFPRPPIATTVMVQKQEMVSPQLGMPLFREYDHDGLLLDLFGSYTMEDGYDVQDVSVTGTKFSVLKLVEGCHHGKYSLLEEMSAWCDRQDEIERNNDAQESVADQRSAFRRDLQCDLEGRN